MAVNHTVIQGRNVRDLEPKKIKIGNDEFDFVEFTVAWSEKRGEKEDQCFQRCKAWRGQAVFLNKYFHNKGAEMIVEGKLITEKWQDKDGNNRSQNVLNVERVHFCGAKRDNSGSQEAPGANGFTEVPESELPF